MPHRIREVLLVSNPYDAFTLEEDGHLTEQIFVEYKAHSLSSAPRVTHSSTGSEAIALLKQRRFDLVLTMTQVADMDVVAFGRRVKEYNSRMPVVLLAMDRRELHRMYAKVPHDAIDDVFLWSGDAMILLAIIKTIEDRKNVEHDISVADVRVIIIIEDSPRYYSSFLSLLYSELMSQSRSLYKEGINRLHRLMYMKSRPKILHATTYEEGMELFHKFQRNVLAVISDVRIPRNGKSDPEAGLELIRQLRRHDQDLPVLVQSSQESNADKATWLNAHFINKNSPSLLSEIRRFLSETLGFGDFIFRMPDGREMARARDVREMREILSTIPPESLEYHGRRNHFSIWLTARSEFDLAARIRRLSINDFKNIEEIRDNLLDSLTSTHLNAHQGMISDFDQAHFNHDPFTRIGSGSLGGKARGIAYLNLALVQNKEFDFGGMKVEIPRTIVIAAEEFDIFLESNGLREFAVLCNDDLEIATRFLEALLPDELQRNLSVILRSVTGPLAVRSSSLLEDSLHQPFAGIYSTVMFPNRGDTMDFRLGQLGNAIKLVYASAFFANAKSYLKSTGYRAEEEKMAIIIQNVVGQEHGDRFYPTFSGVAQSYNYYPIGPMKAEDGIVHVALGLGRLVVDGEQALRFSPKHPEVLPQFSTPESTLNNSQRRFYALDLRVACCDVDVVLQQYERVYDLKASEEDGTLQIVGSVFHKDDGRIVEDFSISGPRVVTFANILKHRAIPFTQAISDVLKIARRGLGGAVEIEFACEMGDFGRSVPRGHQRKEPTLFVLQVRPFVMRDGNVDIRKYDIPRENCLCRSLQSLGQGFIDDIQDVIFVRPDRWESSKNKIIAREVGELNQNLSSQNRSYILIGPGRWGSADEWLGIPVQWSQINNAKVIVEASPKGYNVDPSQGTHFFQNITSLRVGYLTIPPGADHKDENTQAFVDMDWLAQQAVESETQHLCHIRLPQPLTVVLDGQQGQATVVKPGHPVTNGNSQ